MADSKPIKVLIAEPESALPRQLADFLREKGLEVELVNEGYKARDMLLELKPDFVVIDLVLRGFTAQECLDLIAETKSLSHAKVLVTSSHNNIRNVKSCIQSGAADYVIKPYDLNEMVNRMVFQVQKKKKIDSQMRAATNLGGHYFNYVELMLKELASTKSAHQRAFNLTKMLAMTTKAVRISFIQCMDDRQQGFVRVSSDEQGLTRLEIKLTRYPEVLYVMNTEKPVVLENLKQDPMMAKIQQLVKSVSFNSMIVVPVYKRGEFFGVLSTRFGEEKKTIANDDLRFAQMLANMLSMLVATEDFEGASTKEEAPKEVAS